MTSIAAAQEAARQFTSASSRLALQPLGRGLINDTYLVAEGAAHWVLQRINRRVFPDPVAVMANLRKVSDHARPGSGGAALSHPGACRKSFLPGRARIFIGMSAATTGEPSATSTMPEAWIASLMPSRPGR